MYVERGIYLVYNTLVQRNNINVYTKSRTTDCPLTSLAIDIQIPFSSQRNW